MTAPAHTTRRLNDVQLMLLKLFNREMSQSELSEIRDLLLHYLDTKILQQVNTDTAQKGITDEDFELLLNESQRTKNQ